MRKAYSRVRVSLMTFALGLAAVWFVNGPEIVPDEVPVQLQTAVSSEILTVFPTKPGQIPVTSNQASACAGAPGIDEP